MTDRNRRPQEPDRHDREDSERLRRDAENFNDIEGTTTPDRPSVADDSGMGIDRDRRTFNGDREADDLGSEGEDLAYDESEDLDPPRQSER